jgi:hypothetical protein
VARHGAGKPFLRGLEATPVPHELPFFLIFAYDNRSRFLRGPSGDGTVLLRSQLALPVQLSARRSYGVDAAHTGVRTDPTTQDLLLGLLEERAAPRRAGFNPLARLGDALDDLPTRREGDD